MVNIISDYIPPFSSLPNIAPFTYKDGETYLSELENLRTFLNVDLLTFVNANFALLNDATTTEVNTLIAQVNIELSNAASNIATIQTIHDQTVALVASLPDLTTTLNAINTGVANANASATAAAASATSSATNSTTASNKANDASVSAANAAAAGTTAVNNQKSINYGIAELDGTGKILDKNFPPRLLDTGLVAEFAVKAIETTVTTGRLSDTALSAEFITFANNKVYKQFNTYASMIATTGTLGDIAIAANVQNVYFQHDGTSWRMVGTAAFADLASFNAAIAFPVTGMQRKLASQYFSEKYYITPTDGVRVSGWYPVGGILPYVNLGMSAPQNLTVSGGDVAVLWDIEPSNLFAMHSTSVNPTRINIAIPGQYLLTRHITNGTISASQYCAAEFALNGNKIGTTYHVVPSTTLNFACNIHSSIVTLSAGDYVEVKASSNTSSTCPIIVAEALFQVNYMGPA